MASTDYIVLLLYLVLTLAVGLALTVRNKSASQMFAAGGQSPWWAAGLSGFMTMFSAATFTVWGGLAYQYGSVAIAINLCYGVAALLVGYTVAGRWKSLGIQTPAQFIELRYGRPALHFYTWSMMSFRVLGMAIALYSLAVMMVEQMPLAAGIPLRDASTGTMSLPWAIVVIGAVVVAYTMIGGLWGVLMTDVLQFIVLNMAVLFVVPLAITRAGGLTALSAAPPEFFRPVNDHYSTFFLAGWVAVHYFTIGAEWAFVQRFICVPTAADARKGAYLFGGLYLVSPFIWLLPPMIQGVIDPMPAGLDAAAQHLYAERAYTRICETVLPTGMMGLMLAAMFSATASSVSGQLNVFAGVLTRDIYGAGQTDALSHASSVAVGRAFTLLLGTVVIGLALAVPYMGGARDVVIAATSLVVGPLMAPTIWGLLNRRMTQSAVWCTAGVCIVVGGAVKFGLGRGDWSSAPEGIRDAAAYVQQHTPTIDILLGVVLPVATLLVVGLFGRGEAAGWRRVAAVMPQRLAVSAEATGRKPALVISWSLLACGAITAVLALVNHGADRQLLLGFAVGLLALGGWIVLAVRRSDGGTRETVYAEV